MGRRGGRGGELQKGTHRVLDGRGARGATGTRQEQEYMNMYAPGGNPGAKIRALSRLFMRLLIFNPSVYLPLRAHITFLMRPCHLRAHLAKSKFRPKETANAEAAKITTDLVDISLLR